MCRHNAAHPGDYKRCLAEAHSQCPPEPLQILLHTHNIIGAPTTVIPAVALAPF